MDNCLFKYDFLGLNYIIDSLFLFFGREKNACKSFFVFKKKCSNARINLFNACFDLT